jgi:transposase-like protein
LGIVERDGSVRTFAVPTRRKYELHARVRENVQAGSALYSDALKSYDGLDNDFERAVVGHAVEYARGNIHTNTMENFWSLVKRQLHGTYIIVEPFYLFHYLDEQSFRYNGRRLTDSERFQFVCGQIAGRRLTWKRLTGKEANEETV